MELEPVEAEREQAGAQADAADGAGGERWKPLGEEREQAQVRAAPAMSK